MDLKQIGFGELLNLVGELPTDKIHALQAVIRAKRPTVKRHKSSKAFRALLLNGPVMQDKQYQAFLSNREALNTWRS
jgi:hypothetical protein